MTNASSYQRLWCPSPAKRRTAARTMIPPRTTPESGRGRAQARPGRAIAAPGSGCGAVIGTWLIGEGEPPPAVGWGRCRFKQIHPHSIEVAVPAGPKRDAERGKDAPGHGWVRGAIDHQPYAREALRQAAHLRRGEGIPPPVPEGTTFDRIQVQGGVRVPEVIREGLLRRPVRVHKEVPGPGERLHPRGRGAPLVRARERVKIVPVQHRQGVQEKTRGQEGGDAVAVLAEPLPGRNDPSGEKHRVKGHEKREPPQQEDRFCKGR